MRRTVRVSPEAGHREQVEGPVGGDERHVLQLGLGGDDPVERIGVGDVVSADVQRVTTGDVEPLEAAVVELPVPVIDERLRLGESAEPVLRGDLPGRRRRDVDLVGRRPRATTSLTSVRRSGAEAAQISARRYRAAGSDQPPLPQFVVGHRIPYRVVDRRAGELQPSERGSLLALVAHQAGDRRAPAGDDDVLAGLRRPTRRLESSSWLRARSPSWS